MKTFITEQPKQAANSWVLPLFLLAICIAGTVGGSLYFEWPQTEDELARSYAFGRAMGRATVVAIVPLVWWTFVKFRLSRSKGPLVLWLALMVISAGGNFRRAYQVTEFAPDGCDFRVRFIGPTEINDSTLPDGRSVQGKDQAGDKYYRGAQCIPKSGGSGQIGEIDKKSLGLALTTMASRINLTGLALVEENDAVVLTGNSQRGPDRLKWRFLAKEGPNSLVILHAFGPISDFPQEDTAEFFQSLRRK